MLEQQLLRKIPAVDQLLLRPAIVAWTVRTSRDFIVAEIQMILAEIRDAIRSGSLNNETEIGPEHVEKMVAVKLQQRLRPGLTAVINATGVILHTNLGRAPLSTAARNNISAVSAHYTNLEYDISAGRRSHRDKLIESLLREVLGCEAATVVNNNAAAVFLILNTLAKGKDVIVSRGELVEIGGSFRIPEIMAQSGARLCEVGTTNRTRLQDYKNAIGPDTALLLKIHPSNYRMRGFTEAPDVRSLGELARSTGIPLVEDIGSGCLVDLKRYGINDEPMVYDSLSAGVDLICFSGDKLLGGPQAGIIAGADKLVHAIRHNPLMRTYRVDKLVYGALEATLESYRFGKAESEIPVVRMISLTVTELRRRARNFARRLRTKLPEGVAVRLVEGGSVIGGGSCPEHLLRSMLIALESASVRPALIESRLRSQELSIIIRLENDRALIDLRTVFPEQESALLDGLYRAVAASA